ncbi:glycogen/starch/alpha-glucan phosphorylase [Bordetella genomosp. 13]|uniref:Alpha-1,4 glucan phosphorylase n=1 Tax=Bordetella genomosp. 13 TaxID=463040 RepID=A0A1W6ZAK6_9BORD|nr:glycogen/starch/alpha-glucan phosphorylase [Bordetella genomosp. 13]ARP93864.1 glycogen phosphorylase [Bordetella genomosp. 13]
MPDLPRNAESDQIVQDAAVIQQELASELKYRLAKVPERATEDDWLVAICMVVRRRMVTALLATQQRQRAQPAKKVYYLSMEFLVGRSLVSNLLSLGMLDAARMAMSNMGLDLERIADREHDAALGNGGLGRLAACFVESLSTLGLPGMGCGIKYDYGLFRQEFDGASQVERADFWDGDHSPWVIERADESCIVNLYGHVEEHHALDGAYRPTWVPGATLLGIPNDMPIIGFGGRTANLLRLYSARASEVLDMGVFNAGDYVRAVQHQISTETISKVLYPSDEPSQGRELRLIQEYFLTACALHDILREFSDSGLPIEDLPKRAAIQLNDTHPTLVIAELMRLLVDHYHLLWDVAWSVTQATCSYTNHTLLPEALERWPVELLTRVLPRHMQIIYEINSRMLEVARQRWGDDDARVAAVSLIEEGPTRHVRMAHLAIVGSHSINGVAQLHTELIKQSLVPHFYELMPERFNNKTNGITPRRWLAQANPELSALFDETLGPEWVVDLERLRGLARHVDDSALVQRLARIKRANKERLARYVHGTMGLVIDPASLYDVQIKRIHEYKRQLLHILHVIHLYLRLVDHGHDIAPRTHLFAGKAAPGYAAAKRIIHLIRSVARTINSDPRCRGRLSVVFLPDYKVTLAERIIPAADVSEQISTAGTEASGTGNMKLALNGALTVGTLDGANIEIRDCVGPENFYAFGLLAEQVGAMRRDGSYRPSDCVAASPALREVLATLVDGRFESDRGMYVPLRDELLHRDHYFHLADFDAYADVHGAIADDFKDERTWHRKALHCMTHLGHFSSDRTVREYARDIWKLAHA